MPEMVTAANTVTPPPAQSRLLSLDAFRGMVIALMFLVNLSGSRAAFPEWFGHAGWNGGAHGQWLADFVFPWFLFIVGVAIPFSMTSGRGQALSTSQKLISAFKRSLILYFLGVLLFMARTSMDRVDWVGSGNGINGFAPKLGTPISWGTLLHWDIMPLIALGYLVASILWFMPRWFQISFVVAVLAAKFGFMPAMDSQIGLDMDKWKDGRTDFEARTRRIGWLGTGLTQGLPAACCVVIGMWAGQWLALLRAAGKAAAAVTVDAAGGRDSDASRALRRGCFVLFAAGLVLVAVALVLAFPLGHRISKDFFTSSYVLVSAGSGMSLLAIMYWLIDLVGLRRGVAWWFAVLGSNALFIYLVGEILWTMVWMRWRFRGPDGNGHVMFTALQAHMSNLSSAAIGPWLAVLVYTMVYWTISWYFQRRGWIIKV